MECKIPPKLKDLLTPLKVAWDEKDFSHKLDKECFT